MGSQSPPKMNFCTLFHAQHVVLTPKTSPSNLGFWAHTNPGLRIWKWAGYPGFRVPG